MVRRRMVTLQKEENLMTSTVLELLPAGADSLPYDRLTRGTWGDGERVCAMSAMVPGARSEADCVAAGWPAWLPPVVVALYDYDVGVDDEQAAADEWFRQLAEAVASPVDYERGRRRWLIAVLEPIAHLSPVVQPVIDLHRQELAGDAPRDRAAAPAGDAGWAAARAAAWAAAWNAAGDAATAGDAASAAARAAAWAAARDAATAGDAAWNAAGAAAWDTAGDAARDAGDAARGALVAALLAEQVT